MSFTRQVTCTVAAGLKTPKRQQGKEILPQLCLPGELPRSSACSERRCRVFRTAQNVCSGFRNTEIEGFLGGMSRILFPSRFFVDFHGVGGGRISQQAPRTDTFGHRWHRSSCTDTQIQQSCGHACSSGPLLLAPHSSNPPNKP